MTTFAQPDDKTRAETQRIDTAKLRALAEAALPGEWLYAEIRGQVDTSQRAKDGALYDGISWQPEQVDAQTHAQGRYIAAVSPEVVIGLLDQLAAMTAARDEACSWAEEYLFARNTVATPERVARIAELRKVGAR